MSSPLFLRVLWVLGPRVRSGTLDQVRRLLPALQSAGVEGSLWTASDAPAFEETNLEVRHGSGWVALGRAARSYSLVHALDSSAHGLARWAGLLYRRPLLSSYVGEEPPPRPPLRWGGGRLVLPYAQAGWPRSTPVVGEVVPHHLPNVNRIREWLDARGLRAQAYLGWVGASADGMRLALDVLAHLRAGGSDAALLLLGWGDAPLKQIPHHTYWIDRRRDPLAADFFWAFNALLVTENSWAARRGVLEAFQQRVPVVGLAGLLPDLLTEGRAYTGIDLGAALLEAWADANGTAACVEAAFAWAQTRHRPDAVAGEWIRLYRLAVAR